MSEGQRWPLEERKEGWMKGNGGAGGRGKCLYLQNWKKILKTYLTYFG